MDQVASGRSASFVRSSTMVLLNFLMNTDKKLLLLLFLKKETFFFSNFVLFSSFEKSQLFFWAFFLSLSSQPLFIFPSDHINWSE